MVIDGAPASRIEHCLHERLKDCYNTYYLKEIFNSPGRQKARADMVAKNYEVGCPKVSRISILSRIPQR